MKKVEKKTCKREDKRVIYLTVVGRKTKSSIGGMKKLLDRQEDIC
ncbi:Protein of unknown function [Lactobacillus pasteurii DSM 23907 = CRBIP 24.76]|uniref:Uncharacterized protein n=1 Tax=Lactobacillus pasteurii DSM 23907 = CRBIP 24.76 TaxID=1423790 RepID=I7JZ50_9LACO|nr:Protein of unknown function [Lactobacillus pasteurii DSM 23907 = CRBIP 24.76]